MNVTEFLSGVDLFLTICLGGFVLFMFIGHLIHSYLETNVLYETDDSYIEFRNKNSYRKCEDVPGFRDFSDLYLLMSPNEVEVLCLHARDIVKKFYKDKSLLSPNKVDKVVNAMFKSSRKDPLIDMVKHLISTKTKQHLKYHYRTQPAITVSNWVTGLSCFAIQYKTNTRPYICPNNELESLIKCINSDFNARDVLKVYQALIFTFDHGFKDDLNIPDTVNLNQMDTFIIEGLAKVSIFNNNDLKYAINRFSMRVWSWRRVYSGVVKSTNTELYREYLKYLHHRYGSTVND